MQGSVIFEIAVEKLIYISQRFWYLRYEARALSQKKAASGPAAIKRFPGTYVLVFECSSEVIRKRRDVVANIPQPSW